ncbi:peptidase C39 family protein [Deinococcus sp.]|uniref:peptidase C39 family protein n=1 Tax=Deinococcus sp. TaxID=47478 RepID=UPI003C798C49
MFRRLFAPALLVLTGSARALTMTYSHSTTTVLQAPADFRVTGSVLTGPETPAPAFSELIPSWNAATPAGSSLTLEVRVRLAGGWTRWYSFGTWMSTEGRSSLDGQKDASGILNTDTLRLSTPATAYQYRVTLRGTAQLSLLAFTTSQYGTTSQKTRYEATGNEATAGDPSSPGGRAAWGKVLDVPPRSQMIYPGGGEVWCSPTSTSMILAYWGVQVTVPQAAQATYDKAYDGTGNWPFNTAYAGSLGLKAFVSRLPGLSVAERYISAGIPLAVSLGWKAGELPGAAVPSSSGHLMVLVGFDAAGNPVLNDPAAPSDAAVRRSYPRAAFERLWQEHSGGVVYVMAPLGKALP